MENNNAIILERTIPYSPTEIFAAFADTTRLAKWWGPKGFTNTFETCEFKNGGNWKFVMHGPDGTDYDNENTFLEIEADRKVVIRHIHMPHFTLSITLTAVENGTHIHWSAVFDDPKVLAAVRHYAVPGGEQNLDRMHAHLDTFTKG